jgi:hypothetical protein
MLQINNLHATVGDKPIRKGRLAAVILAASLLGACDGAVTKAGDAAEKAEALLDPAKLTEQLPPEVKVGLASYERDLRGAASAYVAQYGQLPANIGDIASVAGARETAVNLIADGLSEQVPFASRETLEKSANGIVAVAERQILERLKAPNAPNN